MRQRIDDTLRLIISCHFHFMGFSFLSLTDLLQWPTFDGLGFDVLLRIHLTQKRRFGWQSITADQIAESKCIKTLKVVIKRLQFLPHQFGNWHLLHNRNWHRLFHVLCQIFLILFLAKTCWSSRTSWKSNAWPSACDKLVTARVGVSEIMFAHSTFTANLSYFSSLVLVMATFALLSFLLKIFSDPHQNSMDCLLFLTCSQNLRECKLLKLS